MNGNVVYMCIDMHQETEKVGYLISDLIIIDLTARKRESA